MPLYNVLLKFPCFIYFLVNNYIWSHFLEDLIITLKFFECKSNVTKTEACLFSNSVAETNFRVVLFKLNTFLKRCD